MIAIADREAGRAGRARVRQPSRWTCTLARADRHEGRRTEIFEGVVRRGKIGHHLFTSKTPARAPPARDGHRNEQSGDRSSTPNSTNRCTCVAGDGNEQMVCTPFGGTYAPGATVSRRNFRFVAPANGPATRAGIDERGGYHVRHRPSAARGPTARPSGVRPTTQDRSRRQNTPRERPTRRQAKHETASTGNLGLLDPPSELQPEPDAGRCSAASLRRRRLGAPTRNGPSAVGCLSSAHTAADDPVIAVPGLDDRPGLPVLRPARDHVLSLLLVHERAVPGRASKLHGVVHNGDQVPACTSGGPTAAAPLCYDPATLLQISNKKRVEVKGFGLENGNWGFN